MALTKKQTAIRLSLVGKQLLEAIAAEMGISQSSVIEVALRDLAKTRGVKVSPPGEHADGVRASAAASGCT